MKKYRVWAKTSTYCYIDVEAENQYDARDIASDVDGGKFHIEEDSGDWEICDVDQLDDDYEVDIPADKGTEEE